MKKNVFLSAAALCLATFSFAISASAQSGQEDSVLLTLPYDVTVDHTVLPAGEYRFSRLNAVNDALMIYSVRNSKSMGVFLCNPSTNAEPSDRTQAVLKHVGDRYIMEELRMAGHTGLELHVAAEDRH